MNIAKRVLGRLRRIKAERMRYRILVESNLFDREWYLRQYPDVRVVGSDPVKHYLETGWKEGRNPSSEFDTNWYLSVNKDVARAKVNPLVHYILNGKAEYRSQKPPKAILETRPLSEAGKHLVQVKEERSAVAVHLHYPDLADELLTACLNVPGDSRILASTTSEEGDIAAKAWASKSGYGKLVLRRSENRGRNVACYTTVFQKELLECDLFCHIHSKKSLYTGLDEWGSNWRQHNLNQLLGSKKHVEQIFDIFRHQDRVGVVSPYPNPEMPYASFTRLSNQRSGSELSRLLGIQLDYDGYFDYPLGNMFWARSEALRQLIDGRIGYNQFAEELGQTDGTLAHAIERCILFVARANGFDWVEVNADAGTYNVGWSERNFFQYQSTRSYKSFIEAIDSAKTVSFDIFDTLITRIVPKPDDLFDMAEVRLDASLDVKTDFHRYRKAAEATLRLAKNSGDVSYDEIYEELQKRPESKHYANEARHTEEELELRLTIARNQVVRGLNEAIERGKRVILTSDMYLQQKQVERLLEKAGVKGYHKLYLSSEEGLRKDDVSMWHHLIEHENAKDPSFIHIGDNEHSDLQLPGILDIRTFHIMSPRNLFDFTPIGYRMRRTGSKHYPLALGPTIAALCNDPFEGRA